MRFETKNQPFAERFFIKFVLLALKINIDVLFSELLNQIEGISEAVLETQ